MDVIHTGPYGVNTLIVPLCGPYVFIVDPACCSMCCDEEKFISFLKSKSYVPAAIVLTHGHFDHVAGLKVLSREYKGIPVLIHKEDAVMIGKNSGKVQEDILYSVGFESFIESVSDLPEPDFFLEDKKTLSEIILKHNFKNDDTEIKNAFSLWRVLHTPGHTKGSVCLYNEKEKLLISGDTVFYHSYGRTDFTGGSEGEMIKSLREIYSTLPHDVKVYPGHEVTGFLLEENLQAMC